MDGRKIKSYLTKISVFEHRHEERWPRNPATETSNP